MWMCMHSHTHTEIRKSICGSLESPISCPVSGTLWVCSHSRINATAVFFKYHGLRTYNTFYLRNEIMNNKEHKWGASSELQLNCIILPHHSIWHWDNQKGYCAYLQVCQLPCNHVSCFVYIHCTPVYRHQKLAAVMPQLAHYTPFLFPDSINETALYQHDNSVWHFNLFLLFFLND